MLTLALLTAAHAADVVWIGEPPDDQRAAVLAASGGQEVALVDLRAMATDQTDADDDALDQLAEAVEAVRSYETQLDGELVIMRDLQPAIDAITLLRNDTDRSALFSALAYQGFAVERYFGDSLATSDDAAPYRTTLNGVAVERPWMDAVALEPEREVTAYDIAEAPQRIAYAGARALVNEVLPASIRPPGDDGVLFVDGRETRPGATGDVKLPPGRHLVHLERAGRVLGRWDLRVDAGEQRTLELPLDDATWATFVEGIPTATTVPEPVQPVLEAAGGEVWFARPGARSPEVWSASGTTLSSVDVAMPKAGGSSDDGGDGPRLHVAVLGGWTGSHDFYYQAPGADPTFGTVNATTIGATAGTDLHLGPLRLGLGIDALMPLGAGHTAKTGDNELRLRPVPHAVVGLGPATVAVGYVFPYHPAVGARGAIPLPGPFELRYLGWFGIPTKPDGYQLRPLGMVAGGVGVRL